MDGLKQLLGHLLERLAELEAAARKLSNQNFADLVKGAHGKLTQASEHPDLEAVGEKLKADIDAKDGPQFPFQDPSKQGSG